VNDSAQDNTQGSGELIFLDDINHETKPIIEGVVADADDILWNFQLPH
jgi:hypothetical protein